MAESPKSPKKRGEIREKRPVQEIRTEIRDYIRNERDTILKKWMALKESLTSEDVRREQFYQRKFKEDTKSLPMNVLKFIGSLKKAVRSTMRHKGGTPYSIVRSMFIYWDADKSGNIDAQELHSCMKSLGVKVSLEECLEIVRYYKAPTQHLDEMDYQELLKDIQRGEPSIIAFVSQSEEEKRDHSEIRFEEVGDRFVQMPPIVKKFLEAVRNYLQVTMRNQGGTPYQHIRFMFTFYDFDYSNGLDPKELMAACRRRMKLAITEDQAKEIVDYYDRKGQGQIYYEKFLEDVCVDVKPILTFTELTPRRIEAAKKSLTSNPFIPKPFQPPPNKILEKFKGEVKASLGKRIHSTGGTYASWIREAFQAWDRNGTGQISSVQHLQGAAKRLGVDLADDDARVVIGCYDVDRNGMMHYEQFMTDMGRNDTHFLAAPPGREHAVVPEPTQRTPAVVTSCLRAIQHAVDKFVKKSKGRIDARDLLHGTFLRFDTSRSGRVDLDAFRQALEELRVAFNDFEAAETCRWFDTNGSQTCDYNAMSKQIYGTDVSNERLVLPRIREANAYTAALNNRSRSTGGLGIAASGNMAATAAASLNDPYMTIAVASSLPFSNGFGVKAGTLERNLDVIESQATKNARMKMKKNKILAERAKVERRLASIEDQRKKVLEEYKSKKAAKAMSASLSQLSL